MINNNLVEVKDFAQRFCDAFGRKGLDGVMDCFWDSPDLIMVLFGNVQRGAEAVRADLAQFFEQNESIKLTVNESSSVPVGDAVMTVGTATCELKPKNGPSTQVVEVWTDLARKIDGRWVYVLDHTTPIPK